MIVKDFLGFLAYKSTSKDNFLSNKTLVIGLKGGPGKVV